jgi:hypothetical protein
MEKAIPTGTYYDFVQKLFNRSGDPSKDAAHAILGVVTEIHEYLSATDEVNGLEELGDLAFYVMALRQVIETVIGPFPDNAMEPSLNAFGEQAKDVGITAVISGVSNELLDIAKRWIGYGKEPKDFIQLYTVARALVHYVNITGPYPCYESARIITVNMAKLLKRYPGGEFDAYRAVVRDLEAERAVLQTA